MTWMHAHGTQGNNEMPTKNMLPRRRTLLGGLTAALAAPGWAQPSGQAPIRIGLIASYTGPYADYGRQFDAGMATWLRENGNRLAGRPVEIVRRDTAGAAPDLAKRAAQELIVRDKVDLIAGLDFSPNAYAIAPVVTQAKVAALVLNASSSGIPAASPYIARLSFTVGQVSAPMGTWMARQGIRRAFTVVADYAPGVDAEVAFRKAFELAGGRVTGALRTPLSTLDFAPYLQRIRDAKPQAVFFFLPSGVMPPAFLKAWKERGMEAAGIRLFATGEATDDSFLQATGDVALGLVTSHHYSYAHPSARNRQFTRNFEAEVGPGLRPNYFAVTAYDGMSALAAALARTQGDTSGDKLVAALAGLKLESPRGMVEIDAATRDVVQAVYIRRVERVGGQLVNVEFDRFDKVRDPGR